MTRPRGIEEKTPRDNIKRQRLVKAIQKALKDKSITSLQSLADQAGYSKNSRQMYSKSTKAYIQEKLEKVGYSIDDCRDFFIFLRKLSAETSDFKEARANNENLTRMGGGFKDKSESTVTLKTDEELETLGKYRHRYKEALNTNEN